MLKSIPTIQQTNNMMRDLERLHDDSANDDSAIDKMAARFWHTDDSATFLFEKKGQNFFPTSHGFHLKTFPIPLTGARKDLHYPSRGVSTPGGSWFLV